MALVMDWGAKSRIFGVSVQAAMLNWFTAKVMEKRTSYVNGVLLVS